ncbi:tRNA (cytosine(72)-C(5))-methyltransferase NSUN6-like [Mercenaria mercenaria]|uniref:tRNA (cytosine(72)-C(5))-methyltransferase NSUN6-like n=1 Tax=Mercenaria mercenaria TaxID=6596 RepID=UPI00234F7039|nr:tRNA (cytosine(72)-C(5))-methyltransferase NSUN6-like [Mercenaria mercenaria]
MSDDGGTDLPPLLLEKEVSDHLKQTWKGDLEVEDEDDENDERFYKLLKQLGTPPTVTTLRVNTLHCDKHVVAKELKPVLEKQYVERGSNPPPIVLHPALKDVLVIPSRGPNSKPPEVKKEVIVDLACGMAVLRGADVFVLGIMGAPAYLSTGEMVAVYADLDAQCRKGLKEEYRERKLYVGCGVMQLSRDQIFCSAQVKLRGVGVKMTHPLYEAPSLDEVLPELVFPQNLPSIVCSLVLDPQPGETVIDMCSSPGGKTNHIATLMKDKGRVIALDKSAIKVEKVIANLKRWNISCVECYAQDSTKCLDEKSEIKGPPPFPPQSFDRVLLDVPCSALGQRPSSRNRMTLKSLQSYPVYQKRFIETGVQLLKTGGTLVYSTCTITMEENERQVAWMLQKYPCLKLAEQNPHLGDVGRPCKGLSSSQCNMLQRFDPTSVTSKSKYFTDNDTIGFFIAKFVKVEDPS